MELLHASINGFHMPLFFLVSVKITLAISGLVSLICVVIAKIIEFFPMLSFMLFGTAVKDQTRFSKYIK